MNQKQIILKVLDGSDWVPSFHLEKAATPFGWIGTSGLRRCRELEAEGRISSRREGRYVYYRINKQMSIEDAFAKGSL